VAGGFRWPRRRRGPSPAGPPPPGRSGRRVRLRPPRHPGGHLAQAARRRWPTPRRGRPAPGGSARAPGSAAGDPAQPRPGGPWRHGPVPAGAAGARRHHRERQGPVHPGEADLRPRAGEVVDKGGLPPQIGRLPNKLSWRATPTTPRSPGGTRPTGAVHGPGHDRPPGLIRGPRTFPARLQAAGYADERPWPPTTRPTAGRPTGRVELVRVADVAAALNDIASGSDPPRRRGQPPPARGSGWHHPDHGRSVRWRRRRRRRRRGQGGKGKTMAWGPSWPSGLLGGLKGFVLSGGARRRPPRACRPPHHQTRPEVPSP